FVAWRGGDPTAYEAGQVSLSPWPHIRREPWGTVLVPLLTFFTYAGTGSAWMMGWASAPFDPLWEHRHPRRAAAMALAGPSPTWPWWGWPSPAWPPCSRQGWSS